MSHQFSPVVGTVVTSTVVFTTSAGAVDDPGVVECVVGAPSGATTTETYNPGNIQRTGLGVYTLNIYVSEAGLWTVQWEGSTTGPNVVECRTFTADAACLTP